MARCSKFRHTDVARSLEDRPGTAHLVGRGVVYAADPLAGIEIQTLRALTEWERTFPTPEETAGLELFKSHSHWKDKDLAEFDPNMQYWDDIS